MRPLDNPLLKCFICVNQLRRGNAEFVETVSERDPHVIEAFGQSRYFVMSCQVNGFVQKPVGQFGGGGLKRRDWLNDTLMQDPQQERHDRG